MPTPKKLRPFPVFWHFHPSCKQTHATERPAWSNFSIWTHGLEGLDTLSRPVSHQQTGWHRSGMVLCTQKDAGACTPAAGLLSMLRLTSWRQLASSVWRKQDPKGSNTSEQTWDLGCSKWLFHSQAYHINTMQSRVSPNTDLDHSKETRQSSRAIVRVGVETVSLTESVSSQAGNRFTTALTQGRNILMFQQGCTTAWPNGAL